MRLMSLRSLLCLFSVCVLSTGTDAAELYGLTPGTVELQSAGPMSFGPSGVLFVGDVKAAKVYALNTEDTGQPGGTFDIADADARLSAAMGSDEVAIADMAVNPETGNVFVSGTAGGTPFIAKMSPAGEVQKLDLEKIGHAAASLPNPPEDKVVQRGRRSRNPRAEAITDIAYLGGRVLISGLSAAESPSSVIEYDFPFRDSSEAIQVEIYHAAHGRNEDTAAIQAFVPLNIDGEPSLLAGYTCTPLVKIPVQKIGETSKVRGTTVAELGNRNRPLDMITYRQQGKDFLLMANTARGVMKVSTENLAENPGLTEPVRGGGTAGQPYETIGSLEGVVQLDKASDTTAIVMIETPDDSLALKTIELP